MRTEATRYICSIPAAWTMYITYCMLKFEVKPQFFDPGHTIDPDILSDGKAVVPPIQVIFEILDRDGTERIC